MNKFFVIFLMFGLVCPCLAQETPLPNNSTSEEIVILSPATFEVIQRSERKGNIEIFGTYSGNPSAIEASFNNGPFLTITSSPFGGTYRGILKNQDQGQGTLTVRFVNSSEVSDSIANIGIGDVFIVAGQSNASGRGKFKQAYSSLDDLSASNFGNDYIWKNLTDPHDGAAGQLDIISDDGGGAVGSYVPLLATLIMNDQHVPVAFVPAAMGGVLIEDWLPRVDHQDRSTLYGSMVYRGRKIQGGVKAVLWWQGESEVIGADEITQEYYYRSLMSLANSIYTDLHCKLMVFKLHQLSSKRKFFENEARVQAAIQQSWGQKKRIIRGPDLSDIGSNSAYHLTSSENLQIVAERVFKALKSESY